MLTIEGREIAPVGIIDDNDDARRAYVWTLEELELDPLPADGPLGALSSFVESVPSQYQALLCDHHLKPGNYASFDGVELVSKLYGQTPAILCTNWQQAELDVIRDYRSRVPVLMKPEDLDPDSFVHGIESCLREFAGEFEQVRRPWRSQVHVVDVDDDQKMFVFVRVPGWTGEEVIRLRRASLPKQIQDALHTEARLHARVNVGAESADDLYFIDWEIK